MKVVFVEGAEQDLHDLRRYILKRFGAPAWQDSYRKLKETVRATSAFPQSGSQPDELLDLNLANYRQVISGQNRIIYEVRGELIYIHVVCDTRRDMKSVLSRRVLGDRLP